MHKLTSKVYFSIILNHYNWFYFEQEIYKRGGIHAPLNLEDLTLIKSKISRVNKGEVVYVDSSLTEKWLQKNKIQTIHILKSKMIKADTKAPKIKNMISNNDYAVILFTSGTIGNSKGVLLSHKNQSASFNEFSKSIIFNNCKSYLDFLGHTFSGGRKVFYSALLSEMKINHNNRNLTLIENLIFYKPDIIACVPYMLNEILDFLQKFGNIFNLKKIICGGAKFNDNFRLEFKKHGVILYNVYGLTETTSLCSYPTSDNYKIGSAGKISENLIYKLSSKKELLLKGENISDGYIENGGFINNIKDKKGFFNTKDIVKVDQENNLFIKGRNSNLVKTNKGEFINISQYLNFEAYQQKKIDIYFLTLNKIKIIAISKNVDALNIKMIKEKLKALKKKGVEFKKIYIFDLLKDKTLKLNYKTILNNIVKEINIK